jgi:hypothetical protein
VARLRIPLACAGIAVIVAILAVVPSLGTAEGRPSILVRMSDREPMAAFARAADPAFAFVPPNGHYDGVYYYAIALDPIAQGAQHAVLIQPAYRYRNPLYGWLSGVVGLGRANVLPASMLLVNLLAFAVAAALVSLLASTLGASGWLGLLVALNPGFVIALTVDTAEPLAMALIAAGVLAWIGGRRWLAALVLTAATFTREIGVAVALGILLYEVVAWRRQGRGRPSARRFVRRMVPLLVAPLAYAAWWLYLWARLGSWPVFEPSNLAIPPAGVLDTLQRAARLTMGTEFEIQLGIAMVALLAVSAVALVLALLRSLRVRTVLDGIAIPVTLLVLSLNWWPTLYPKEMLRNFAIAAVLLGLAVATSAGRGEAANRVSGGDSR